MRKREEVEKLATELIEKLIINDYDEAERYFYIGMLYEKENYLTDAMSYYGLAAHCGYFPAQMKLGDYFISKYNEGIETFGKDEAIYWYGMAANNGHMPAMLALAQLYEDERDTGKAIYWYDAAAERGSSIAQDKLTELTNQRAMEVSKAINNYASGPTY